MVKEQICEPKISDAGTLSTAPNPEEHRQCNLTEENKDVGLWVWFIGRVGIRIGARTMFRIGPWVNVRI